MEKIPLRVISEPPEDSKIVKAAIVINDMVYLHYRHHYILQELKESGEYDRLTIGNGVQGFVDQHGYFYEREVSAKIAFKAAQVKELRGIIYSEDLWYIDGTMF